MRRVWQRRSKPPAPILQDESFLFHLAFSNAVIYRSICVRLAILATTQVHTVVRQRLIKRVSDAFLYAVVVIQNQLTALCFHFVGLNHPRTVEHISGWAETATTKSSRETSDTNVLVIQRSGSEWHIVQTSRTHVRR